MRGERNPWEVPEWHAIGREAALVRHLVGSGATALGRANYADNIGEYYTAFFGLSVGVERLAKLILVADYAISNGGQMPGQAVVRKFGHKLVELTDAADPVAEKHKLTLIFPRPTDAIGAKIVECLVHLLMQAVAAMRTLLHSAIRRLDRMNPFTNGGMKLRS